MIHLLIALVFFTYTSCIHNAVTVGESNIKFNNMISSFETETNIKFDQVIPLLEDDSDEDFLLELPTDSLKDDSIFEELSEFYTIHTHLSEDSFWISLKALAEYSAQQNPHQSKYHLEN